MAERECGGCTLCCTLLDVPPYEAPPGVDCRHCVQGQGCGNYEARDALCSGFQCFWLKGSFRDDERPDRIGVCVTRDTKAKIAEMLPKQLKAAINDMKQPWQVTAVADRRTPGGRRLLNRLLVDAGVLLSVNGDEQKFKRWSVIARKEWGS